MERWRHPNGLVWAMCIDIYGHAGAWAETLGMAGPLNEMLLQSYSRILNIFPAWPKKIDARFRNFRAEGAFLVSAARKDGKITSVEITSEKGRACRLFSPWKGGFTVKDDAGRKIPVVAEAEGVFRFETVPGATYSLSQTK